MGLILQPGRVFHARMRTEYNKHCANIYIVPWLTIRRDVYGYSARSYGGLDKVW
jgi:hypothetical protein